MSETKAAFAERNTRSYNMFFFVKWKIMDKSKIIFASFRHKSKFQESRLNWLDTKEVQEFWSFPVLYSKPLQEIRKPGVNFGAESSSRSMTYPSGSVSGQKLRSKY